MSVGIILRHIHVHKEMTLSMEVTLTESDRTFLIWYTEF